MLWGEETRVGAKIPPNTNDKVRGRRQKQWLFLTSTLLDSQRVFLLKIGSSNFLHNLGRLRVSEVRSRQVVRSVSVLVVGATLWETAAPRCGWVLSVQLPQPGPGPPSHAAKTVPMVIKFYWAQQIFAILWQCQFLFTMHKYFSQNANKTADPGLSVHILHAYMSSNLTQVS